jgi:opacity protein-like surface antigen
LKKILIALCCLINLANAATPLNGLYFSGFGGPAFISGNIDRTNGDYYFNHSQYDTGFNAGASLGYQTDLWHIEAEIDFIKANLAQLNLNGNTILDVDGYSQAYFGFLNANYDLPYQIANLIQAYIGGGIGYGWLQNNYNLHTIVQEQIHNSAFAYHGTAGLHLNLSQTLTLGVYYRYLSTTQVNTLGSRFQANLVNGSITYHFDSCELK